MYPSHSTPNYVPKRKENICSHKDCIQLLTAELFIKTKPEKHSEHPQS